MKIFHNQISRKKLQNEISHRFVATLRINELSEDDLDHRDNHILKMTNSEGSITYYITISNSRSCSSRSKSFTSLRI